MGQNKNGYIAIAHARDIRGISGGKGQMGGFSIRISSGVLFSLWVFGASNVEHTQGRYQEKYGIIKGGKKSVCRYEGFDKPLRLAV